MIGRRGLATDAKFHLLPSPIVANIPAFNTNDGPVSANLMLMRFRLTQTLAAALLVASALGTAGCGAKETQSVGPSSAQLQSGLQGSPPALHAQQAKMGKILTTGRTGFNQALASLKGFPVVVNAWASWCGPCRYEFPLLGQASLQLGKTTGFLGVNTRDDKRPAQKFLDAHHVGYPSWSDADGSIASSIGVASGLPVTVIFDVSGKRSYIHQGPYSTLQALADDVKRYGGASK